MVQKANPDKLTQAQTAALTSLAKAGAYARRQHSGFASIYSRTYDDWISAKTMRYLVEAELVSYSGAFSWHITNAGRAALEKARKGK